MTRMLQNFSDFFRKLSWHWRAVFMSGRAQKETGPKKVLISSGSVFIFLASIRQIYAQPSAASQSYSAILLPYMDFDNTKSTVTQPFPFPFIPIPFYVRPGNYCRLQLRWLKFTCIRRAPVLAVFNYN